MCDYSATCVHQMEPQRLNENENEVNRYSESGRGPLTWKLGNDRHVEMTIQFHQANGKAGLDADADCGTWK